MVALTASVPEGAVRRLSEHYGRHVDGWLSQVGGTIHAAARRCEERHRQFESDLHEFLLGIPNLPDDRLPDGNSDEFAVEVRTWGNPLAFDFAPADHVDIGERLGIFDFPRATKLAGPRFAVLRGVGAQLERAISAFLLQLHTQRHGYTEYSVPAPGGRHGLLAQYTYDIEVWLPSQLRYREISSVSDCGVFQARRADIRTKSKDGKRGFAATLNGSGLPIGRTLVAILEQYQEAAGSVRMPDVLVGHLGFNRINADGTTAMA